MSYLVVIEKAEDGYGAYVPDLPGVIALGDTLDEVRGNAAEAIRVAIEDMREHGEPIPEPTSIATMVPIDRAS
jgi:predicted RNase H-like HicB family nuclease